VSLGDLWALDVQSLGRQPDSWGVVRAAALGHAFLEHRLLEPGLRSEPLAGNAEFEKAVFTNIEAIQSTGLAFEKESFIRRAAEAIRDEDPLKRILTLARIVDFGQKNAALLAAFAKKDWKAFLPAAIDCSTYTFKEFPEPRLCLCYASLSVRCPGKVESSKLGREWNSFGYACWSLGFEEGEARARKELQRYGFESYIRGWPSIGRFLGDRGVPAPFSLDIKGPGREIALKDLGKVFGSERASLLVDALSSEEGADVDELLGEFAAG